ncbi:hypothetical protein SKAU_G00282820 [Synaphobranchus kaupii]|uniref:Uncharacterized protein n=1 Tax=Synaphobranchus kaupii TaxID=118154 RepID=A0A9Q1EXF3_SYNKA|nr:hypothetical protein SKAU_G00282820 [Synaphobranchus kaupii]
MGDGVRACLRISVRVGILFSPPLRFGPADLPVRRTVRTVHCTPQDSGTDGTSGGNGAATVGSRLEVDAKPRTGAEHASLCTRIQKRMLIRLQSNYPDLLMSNL